MTDYSRRVLHAAVWVMLASLVVSLAINGLLFVFGPWADVWVEQTWLALAVLSAVLVWSTRSRWLPHS